MDLGFFLFFLFFIFYFYKYFVSFPLMPSDRRVVLRRGTIRTSSLLDHLLRLSSHVPVLRACGCITIAKYQTVPITGRLARTRLWDEK
jgi:hypothetical protein